jgi:hypothetical protein
MRLLFYGIMMQQAKTRRKVKRGKDERGKQKRKRARKASPSHLSGPATLAFCTDRKLTREMLTRRGGALFASRGQPISLAEAV